MEHSSASSGVIGERMAIEVEREEQARSGGAARRGGCPVEHHGLAQAKTLRSGELDGPAVERDAAGVWHVRGYAAARSVLRNSATRQAGFKAELMEHTPSTMRPPVIFQDGEPHHAQRKQTARFFTPKVTSENYRQLMESLADEMVAQLQQVGRADLSKLGMKMAVRVASEVIGLTDSLLPGMDRRINAFFASDITGFSWSPRALLDLLQNQLRMLKFFYLDVQPAMRARRRAPRADVISHLLESGYRGSEILVECITYGAAGMVTTREFISLCVWHMLEQPDLRAHYLRCDEPERLALLQEILRLEPVVGHLYRRATADLTIEADGATLTIPVGALIDVQVAGANTDETVVGAQPLAICPARELRNERVGPAVMSFGDGHHRCPGAYIAIQETDIFLQRLLRLETLRIERPPTLSWSELTTGYELRDFIVALG